MNITVAEAKELFTAMLNNRKMALDCMGFTSFERDELEKFTKIYRDNLEEWLRLNNEMNRITKQ